MLLKTKRSSKPSTASKEPRIGPVEQIAHEYVDDRYHHQRGERDDRQPKLRALQAVGNLQEAIACAHLVLLNGYAAARGVLL